MEDFFGYNSGSVLFDKRRHLNTLFCLLIHYHFILSNSLVQQIAYYLKNKDRKTTALFISNEIFSFGEHNYLNLLREKYQIPEDDFLQIMGGIGLLERVNKTPAGYNFQKNISLLVEMLVSRIYMQPQDSNALQQINNIIAHIAHNMSPQFTGEQIQTIFNLSVEAMHLYPNESMLDQIEKYVIKHLNK